jgi:TonB family protein
MVPMPYPSEMRRLGIAGRVSVHYVIDSTGAVIASSIQIDSASQPEFVPAALELLTTSRFKPAIRTQQRVAVCVKQDLNWVLS